MVLNIRSAEADNLARELAQIDQTTITNAVVSALRETLSARRKAETPSETARKILEKHGLSFKAGRRAPSSSAYHELDHDLDDDT